MNNLITKVFAADEIINNPTNLSSAGAVLVLAVRILLIGAGVVAVLAIIVGGYTYITSVGNPENVGKAKATIMYGVIGLLICLLAVYIVQFLFIKYLGVTGILGF